MKFAWPGILAVVLALTLFAAPVGLPGGSNAGYVSADEGWLITSFEARYTLRPDGVAEIVEDIRVDFGMLEKHGIFRDIPIRYKYDDRNNRKIILTRISVTDGEKAWKYSTSNVGSNRQLKIGDANKTISGPQRYVITYEVRGAFNAFDDYDEFYWNVTGAWPVQMARVTMTGTSPANRVTCFQGPSSSTDPCRSSMSGNTQRFETTRQLRVDEQLTVVAGLPKGAVTFGPPLLEEIKSPLQQIKDFMGIRPVPIIGAIVLAILGLGLVLRQWWLAGRDRWFGDVHYLTGKPNEILRPPFARETVVTEYTPPELRNKRRLRPAELGLLLDEKADTIDVSATIIDLAVRGYIHIEELPKEGLLGSKDYKLTKLKERDDALLTYEGMLLDGIFSKARGDVVEMSDLKNEFYKTLDRVKSSLETQGVSENKFFPKKPSSVRTTYLMVGVGLTLLGGPVVLALGALLGWGIMGAPLILAGLLMMILATAMPHRTALGRELYRRTLGFREYMTVAETDRQRFNEDENIFAEYLPYAIVMKCTDKWAKRFEAISNQPGGSGGTYRPSWYSGTNVFAPAAFATSIAGFSSSVSSTISSTPGSSGSSGFSSGGGSSGGGFGGGGGGSW